VLPCDCVGWGVTFYELLLQLKVSMFNRMVLISNSTIAIKNHHKIKQIEKKRNEDSLFSEIQKAQISFHNTIIANKYPGLLEDKYTYEPSDEESEEEAKPVSKSKNKTVADFYF